MESQNVLLISLDSCRFDTFRLAYEKDLIPNLASIAPLHKALAPSYFTYGSHAAIWMGFTPGVVGSNEPLLNPKSGKLFRMKYAGSIGDDEGGFLLEGSNIIEGFNNLGYRTIGSGAVEWFNPETDTGSVLSKPFQRFYFPGNTWSLDNQLQWIQSEITETPSSKPIFLFLNIGETHVPYWHQGASWDCWPSPCIPFGGANCSAKESAKRQLACLQWIDKQIGLLIETFSQGTILAFGDHGDCWGENGLWEHGISHPSTLTVPLLMRNRGVKVSSDNKSNVTNPNLFRSILSPFLLLRKIVFSGQ